MQQRPLANAVGRVVHASLPAEAGLDPEDVGDLLTEPPSRDMGDFAFPCFRLAKALRRAPAAIATSLAQTIDTTNLIESAEAAGPYVNLRVRPGLAAALVIPPFFVEPTRRDSPPPRERVMVEYSQPNTHKAFHVGHMRNLCLGDAIVRLLRATGHEVIAANYLGDVGAHIARCLWWFLDVLDESQRAPPASRRGEWLGELYAAASNQLADWEDAAKTGDAKAEAKLQHARKRTTEILQALERRDPEMTAVWERTRQWSLEEFDEIYEWCGVKFDVVFYESDVDVLGLQIVDEYLEKGVFTVSEGAIGVFNEDVKHMPFFMLRKSDGTSLYATKDLALAKVKFERHEIDRSIYVVDSRQSDHFRHVFLTLEKMGLSQAAKCEHIPYEMVELADGPMATRRGNVILFGELRSRMVEYVRTNYLDKYAPEWPANEITETAHMVALGAIKYGMLNRDVNQKIVFELETWLDLEGNTGPYLQYAVARNRSIVRKCAVEGKVLATGLVEDVGLLAQACGALGADEERDLIIALDGFNAAVTQAGHQLRPHILCTYLHGLAKAYNRFNRACNVKASEGPLLQARLLLVHGTIAALSRGLACLGIPAPDRM